MRQCTKAEIHLSIRIKVLSESGYALSVIGVESHFDEQVLELFKAPRTRRADAALRNMQTLGQSGITGRRRFKKERFEQFLAARPNLIERQMNQVALFPQLYLVLRG